jgi:hypothetical protein
MATNDFAGVLIPNGQSGTNQSSLKVAQVNRGWTEDVFAHRVSPDHTGRWASFADEFHFTLSPLTQRTQVRLFAVRHL